MERSIQAGIASVLKSLVRDDFRDRVAFASTPSVLRETLSKTPEVASLREGLRSGTISDREVREFVNLLLTELQRDVRFPEDFALAAIAVAFETHYSSLAQEYLKDLSSLHLRELSIASAVARESLKHRSSISVEIRTTTAISIDGGKLLAGSGELKPGANQTKNTLMGDDVNLVVVFNQRFLANERAAA